VDPDAFLSLRRGAGRRVAPRATDWHFWEACFRLGLLRRLEAVERD